MTSGRATASDVAEKKKVADQESSLRNSSPLRRSRLDFPPTREPSERERKMHDISLFVRADSSLTFANLSSPPTSGAPSKMGGAPRGRRGPWCLAQRTASAAASTAAMATRISTAIA